MSGISGPNLVTSGLVFAADAANMKSYLENSLSSSNDFSNATYWDKTSFPCIVTLNSTIAPDGTTTGNTVAGNNGVTSLIFQSIPIATSGTAAITASIYAKANTGTTFTLNVYYDGDTEVNTSFNLSTGTIAGGSGVITSVGNGWYRCSLNVPARVGSGTTVKFRIWPNPRADATNRSIDVWGAQVNHGTAAAPYTPTTATAVAKTLNDLSNNGNNSSTAIITYDSSGGGSLLFNGTSGYIAIPNSATMRPSTELTIEYIIKRSVSSNVGWFPIFGYSNGAGLSEYTNGNYLVWQEADADGSQLRALCEVNTTEYRCNVTNFPSSSVFTHVTYTMKTGDAIRPYFNGVASGTTTVLPAGTFTYTTTTNPYNIGGRGDVQWSTGNIAMVKLYNRALSATEVAQNFNATKIRYGL
jgi:hypothetical protein